MKKILCLILSLAMLLSATSAFALGYTGRQGNEATFELLEETRISSPIAVQNLETNTTKKFVSAPVLDDYPTGTTYVYRSANLYGGRASARQNTNLVIFAEQAFASKDDAFAYLKGLGVIDIIDEAVGSVVLVTPANGKTFGAADQKNYYKLQTAMFGQKAGGRDAEGNSVSYSDAEYFGGYSFFYVVGIDGGATFINNYVAGVLDYVSRIGGMLLINGKMERISKVADCVPVMLINADDAIAAKYEAANGVSQIIVEGAKKTAYNAQFPVRKVVTLDVADVDAAALIKDAYYNLFVKAQRSQSLKSVGYNSASSPYQGYAQDAAPYSLFPRNAIINGRTADGINLIMMQEDWFNSVTTEAGEYLETWFEYLPDEVLDGTAPAGTIPLLVLQHGGGDDPRLYVEEQGYLELMGDRRIAAVAPEHQYITNIVPEATTLLVNYMLDKYPALDRSRVYVTGYSMGGWATYDSAYGDASLYAAAFAMAIASARSSAFKPEYEEQFATVDLPMMASTSEYDYFVNGTTHNMTTSYLAQTNAYLGFNEMPLLEGDQDFEAYPIIGYESDVYFNRLLNDEYWNHTWLYLNDEGVPMVGLNYTEDITHALYAGYADVVWDWFKHFSRDQETGEIVYDPLAW